MLPGRQNKFLITLSKILAFVRYQKLYRTRGVSIWYGGVHVIVMATPDCFVIM